MKAATQTPFSSEHQHSTYHFEIRGNCVGKVFATVDAPTVEAARARMAPLFPGCEIIVIDVSICLGS